jgi:predicted deacylase
METSVCLFLILLMILLLYAIVKPYCTKLEHFSIKSNKEGPNILFVGSAHGNEPAGYEGLKMLQSAFEKGLLKVTKGSITIIPLMNPCGKMLHLRFQPHQILIGHAIDLNRNFGKRKGDKGRCTVSREIEEAVSRADIVIDMHEGYDFHNINPESMGSCLFPGKTEWSEKLATEMVQDLNETITFSPNPSYSVLDIQFQVKKDWDDIPGTLRWYCNQHDKDYILIETTGQGDIQPLDIRALQNYQLAISACKRLGVIN